MSSAAPPSRFAAFVSLAAFVLVGLYASAEIWNLIATGTLGFRLGGVTRSEFPVLFWAHLAVAGLIALIFWLAVLVSAAMFVLWLTKGRGSA